MENSYFDLHIHASLKHFLTLDRKGNRRSVWSKITHWTSPAGNFVPGVRSQSSLGQLAQSKVKLAVACLYPMEYALARAIHSTGMASLLTPVKKHFIRSIAREEYDYFQLLMHELEYLLAECAQGPAQVMRHEDDWAGKDLKLILGVEGGHAIQGASQDSTLANLRHLKQSAYRFLYLTLSHLTRSPLSNHAYGMKKVMGRLIQDPAFFPGSVGLSSLGKAVIREAYDQDRGQRIFIDIKHMSLLARQQFYQMRRKEGMGHIPIIASHCAATGFAYENLAQEVDFFASGLEGDYVKVVYRRGEKNSIRPFNPWSINLYDEEISEIVDSGGLIGLTVDERILGNSTVGPEYFFAEEFDQLYPQLYRRLERNSKVIPLQDRYQLSKSKLDLFRSRNQLYFLAHNILHMVKVAGPQTWDHLCLGSDFDGLIKPINRVKSINSFQRLEEGYKGQKSHQLVHALREMAWTDPAFPTPIPDLSLKVRRIMFDNAKRFLHLNF